MVYRSGPAADKEHETLKIPVWARAIRGLKGTDRDPAANPIFSAYEERLPSQQNAIDAVAGWNSQFPAALGLTAGRVPLFEDGRIHWAIGQFGPIEGKHVLELGPLEGGHTSMLEAAGANVLAIEANKTAFLRCLVTKEIRSLRQSRFMLGDCIKWLETTEDTYDLVVASGVLYHMRDPLRLLRAIAKKTTCLYLWTMCFTDETLKPTKIEMLDDLRVRLYLQTYANVQTNKDFCGGMEERHYWLHRDDILAALKTLGFSSLIVGQDEPDHPYGPAFSVFARKDNPEEIG